MTKRSRANLRPVAAQLVKPKGPVHAALSSIVLSGAREAVRLVPRDTGNLANSINTRVDVQGTKARGVIQTNVEYAAPVEFGTHRRGEPDAPGKVSHRPGGKRARPYMRPGLLAGVTYARRKGLIR